MQYAPIDILADDYGNVHVLYRSFYRNDGAICDAFCDSMGLFYCNCVVNVFHQLVNTGTVTNLTNQEWPSTGRRPSMALDADGDLHVAWLEKTWNEQDTLYDHTRIKYRKRELTGGNWTNAITLSYTDDQKLSAPGVSVGDDGYVYVAWTAFLDQGREDDIVYRRCEVSESGDSADWSERIRVTGPQSDNWHHTNAKVVRRNGALHCASAATRDDYYPNVAWDFLEYRYNADAGCFGETCWTAVEVVQPESCWNMYYDLAVDNAGCAHILFNGPERSICAEDLGAYSETGSESWHVWRQSYCAGELIDSLSCAVTDTSSIYAPDPYKAYFGKAFTPRFMSGKGNPDRIIFSDDGRKYPYDVENCPDEGPCAYKMRLTTTYLGRLVSGEGRWDFREILWCDSTGGAVSTYEVGGAGDTTFHVAFNDNTGESHEVYYVTYPDSSTRDSTNTTVVWRGTKRLCQDIGVPAGDTLVIEAGTTILVDPTRFCGREGAVKDTIEIRVHGTLLALGEEENPIVFRSVGRGSSDWAGVRIEPFSSDDETLPATDPGRPLGVFEHCEIRHARTGIYTRQAPDVEITECVIDSCSDFCVVSDTASRIAVSGSLLRGASVGIAVSNNDSPVEVHATVIESCATKGISVQNSDSVAITECVIRDNGGKGIYASETGLRVAGTEVIGHADYAVKVDGRDGNRIEIDSCYLGGRSGEYGGKGFVYSDAGLQGVADILVVKRSTFKYLGVGIEINLPEYLFPGGGTGWADIRLGEGDFDDIEGNEILYTDVSAFDLAYPRNMDIRCSAVQHFRTGVISTWGNSCFGDIAQGIGTHNCFVFLEDPDTGDAHVIVETTKNPGVFKAEGNYWSGVQDFPSCTPVDSLFHSTGAFDLDSCLVSLPYSFPWGWWPDEQAQKRGSGGPRPTGESPAPYRIALRPNRPNPFNPSTTIEFTIPGAPGTRTRVRISIYDVAGRLVTTLADGLLEAGPRDVVWEGMGSNGGPVASGVYFVRLEGGGETVTRKLVIVR